MPVSVEVTPYVLRAKGTRRKVVNATMRALRAQGLRATPEQWTLLEQSYDPCVEAYFHHPDDPPERVARYLNYVTIQREPAVLALLAEMRRYLEECHAG